MNFSFKKFFLFIHNLLLDSLKTSFVLFKIMIPVTIIVKILQELDLIKYFGEVLYPLMKFVGLPGEYGLVWATGMITNLFGGIIAFISISDNFQLTIAQVTVITSMMLIAHSFPVELQVARKAGARLVPMFLIRFFFSFLFGVILYFLYSHFQLLQEKASIKITISNTLHPSFWIWILGELKKYAIIFLFVTGLLLLVKILKHYGILELMNKIFKPLFRIIGVGKEAIPITIIGLTLGVTYGGALIVEESKSGKIKNRDIFYSLVMMGLCHSIIEDTILMVGLGGDISGILVLRFLFSFLITFLIVVFTKKLNENSFQKLFFRHK